jgi:hypothetical protein
MKVSFLKNENDLIMELAEYIFDLLSILVIFFNIVNFITALTECREILLYEELANFFLDYLLFQKMINLKNANRSTGLRRDIPGFTLLPT